TCDDHKPDNCEAVDEHPHWREPRLRQPLAATPLHADGDEGKENYPREDIAWQCVELARDPQRNERVERPTTQGPPGGAQHYEEVEHARAELRRPYAPHGI